MKSNDLVVDIFCKIASCGIHHPVHFHSFSSSFSIFPFKCGVCSDFVVPFTRIGTCLKCSLCVHRSCCNKCAIVCPVIITGKTGEDVAFQYRKLTDSVLSSGKRIVISCRDNVWKSNLMSIWMSVVSAQKHLDDTKFTDDWTQKVLEVDAKIFESSIQKMLVNGESFIGFTVTSLLKLYLERNSDRNASGRAQDSFDEQSVHDCRECLNVCVQAVILWLSDLPKLKALGINNELPDNLDERHLGDTFLERFQEDLWNNTEKWRDFVNVVEVACLTWNSFLVYRMVYESCQNLTRVKDSNVRQFVNRNFTYSEAVLKLGSESMHIVGRLDYISTQQYSPLDKLYGLVKVLQEIAVDIESTAKRNEDIGHKVKRGLRSVISMSNIIRSSESSASQSVLVDTDALISRVCDVLRVSYLSGNGINWYAEIEFITKMIFTAGKSEISELLAENNYANSLLDFLKPGLSIMNHDDWLLGAEGYALVTFQQGLSSLQSK